MQNKSNINAEQMQHNAEQKYHYKHQRINVKQLTHDVAQKPSRCCPETGPYFGHSIPAVCVLSWKKLTGYKST